MHIDMCQLLLASKSVLQEKIVGSQGIETRNPLAELLSRREAEMAWAGCACVARDSLDTWLGGGGGAVARAVALLPPPGGADTGGGRGGAGGWGGAADG